MSHPRKRLAVALPLALVLAATAACGGGSDHATASPQEFPTSAYPTSVYGGLSGKLTYYDTGGGSGIAALNATVDKDYTALTGVKVVDDYNATMTKFNAAMQAGQGQWDVVEFATGGDAKAAQEHGYLEKLDPSVVPLDKVDDKSATDYYFPSHRYGIVLAWNTDKFPAGKAPTTMADLFDTQRFPGKRCMFEYPQFGATMESALLAGGAAPGDLYPLDVKSALTKLDTIKNDIVWWTSGDQAIQYLTSGECDLGVVWTGRLFDAVTNDHAPLDFTWNGGLYASGYYGVPTNAPNKGAAQAYLAHFLTNTGAQEAFLKRFPYPAPIKDLQIPPSVAKWVPLGQNIANAEPEDEDWYSANITGLSKTFTDWVGQ
ncbi:ABC transporter substrate-binding protein [Nocardioides sp. AN3]